MMNPNDVTDDVVGVADGVTFGGLRKEMAAALDSISDQVQGLDAFFNAPGLSADTHDAIQEARADHNRRKSLINAVVKALHGIDLAWDALQADGYADMPKADISAMIMEEIQAELEAMQAAFKQFEIAQAKRLTISLGTPAGKPEV